MPTQAGITRSKNVAVQGTEKEPASSASNGSNNGWELETALGMVMTTGLDRLPLPEALTLQRSIGNRGLARFAGNPAPHPVVQAQLMVGPVDDSYEKEADRVADQVMLHHSAGMVARPAAAHLPSPAGRDGWEEGRVQTSRLPRYGFGNTGLATVSPELEEELAQKRGDGEALPEKLLTRMEGSFGTDFSGVRIHADAQADRFNHSLQALSFTSGRDIFFRQGAYQPGNYQGQRLLAHELTHVLQQNGRQSGPNGSGTALAQRNLIQRVYLDQPDSQAIDEELQELRSEFATNHELIQQLDTVEPLLRAYYEHPGNASANQPVLTQIKQWTAQVRSQSPELTGKLLALVQNLETDLVKLLPPPAKPVSKRPPPPPPPKPYQEVHLGRDSSETIIRELAKFKSGGSQEQQQKADAIIGLIQKYAADPSDPAVLESIRAWAMSVLYAKSISGFLSVYFAPTFLREAANLQLAMNKPKPPELGEEATPKPYLPEPELLKKHRSAVHDSYYNTSSGKWEEPAADFRVTIEKDRSNRLIPGVSFEYGGKRYWMAQEHLKKSKESDLFIPAQTWYAAREGTGWSFKLAEQEIKLDGQPSKILTEIPSKYGFSAGEAGEKLAPDASGIAAVAFKYQKLLVARKDLLEKPRLKIRQRAVFFPAETGPDFDVNKSVSLGLTGSYLPEGAIQAPAFAERYQFTLSGQKCWAVKKNVGIQGLYLSKKEPLFPAEPKAEDIQQGNIGDCYMEAALISIVSQDPGRIMKMMQPDTGKTVTVTFYANDLATGGFVAKPIEVRKTVPVSGARGDLYNEGALWVRILQKAYAVFSEQFGKSGYGTIYDKGYDAIVGGNNSFMYKVFYGPDSLASESLGIKDGFSQAEELLIQNQAVLRKLISLKEPGRYLPPGQAVYLGASANSTQSMKQLLKLMETAPQPAESCPAFHENLANAFAEVDKLNRENPGFEDFHAKMAELKKDEQSAFAKLMPQVQKLLGDLKGTANMEAASETLKFFYEMLLNINTLGTDHKGNDRFVYSRHAYAIIGIDFQPANLDLNTDDGLRKLDLVHSTVTLRNPHHRNSPTFGAITATPDDGKFTITLAQFLRNFTELDYGIVKKV